MGESDKAAIYARKSTGKETDNSSIDEQLKACRQYAAEHGWTVDERHVFKEIGSGKTIWERPQMMALLTAVTNGEVQHLVCWHNDRRARNVKESGWLDTEATRYGAKWHFVDPGMVLPGIEDEDDIAHMEAMEAYFSAKERKRIHARMSWGRQARLNAGGRQPGSDPYGWTQPIESWTDANGKERGHWTLKQHDDEAPVVEEIYRRLVTEHQSVREVTRWLQSSGHPTPKGNPSKGWRDRTITVLVRNPVHMGLVVTRRHRGNGAGWERPREEWVVIENAPTLTPIVDAAMWEAANEALAGNRRRSGGQKNPNNEGLLAWGHLRCDCAGHGYALGWVPSGGGQYRTDRKNPGCTQMAVSSRPIDGDVWAEVSAALKDPDVILRRIADHTRGDTARGELAAQDAAVRKLEERAEGLTNGYTKAKSEVVRAALEPQLEAALLELESAKSTRAFIAARAGAAAGWVAGAADLFDQLKAEAARIDTLDLDERREVLRRLRVKVYLKPKGAIAEGERRWKTTIGMMPPARELAMDDLLPDWWQAREWYQWDAIDWGKDLWTYEEDNDDFDPPLSSALQEELRRRGREGLDTNECSGDTDVSGDELAPRQDTDTTLRGRRPVVSTSL